MQRRLMLAAGLGALASPALAQANDPNSANSQFFIMFAPAPSLDGQYTIWGRVTAGMEAVDKIKRGSGGSGVVQGPDRLRSMRVAADIR